MPKKTYRRLREADRHIIYRMRIAGNSQCQIAYVFSCAQSTVSKDLRRNRGRSAYRPKQAQQKAASRSGVIDLVRPLLSVRWATAVRERLSCGVKF